MRKLALLLISVLSLMAASFAQQRCGRQAGGIICPGRLCCSMWGYCGRTAAYCRDGCQSNCWRSHLPSTPGVGNISSIVTESLFEEMLKHRNDNACPGKGFYTYEAFISAANSFPAFGNTGDIDTRKREIAAFLAQTSQETTGGWSTAPDGPYAWGYCFVVEQQPSDPIYYGRGPIQLTHKYNYAAAGEALNYDLVNDPDALARWPILSFQSAFWFWMTPQPPKPSCHDVITNQWIPSDIDKNKGRVPSYGVITNIINGGVECGHGYDERVANRIGFYKRYCDLMGVDPGDNLDCYNQRPFNEQVIASATAM